MKRWRWTVQLAVLAAAIVWLAGCSAGSKSQSANSMPGAAADASAEYAVVESEAAAVAEQPAAEESGTASAGSGMGAAVENQPVQSGRMLIYTANMSMEVEHYGDAYSKLQDLIHLSGGYIVGFTEETSEYEKTGIFTIKVPAGGFNGFLSKLEQIPNVNMSRSLKAQDVSEEYVDLESRLKAKQVVEERLLGFMEKASKTDDLVRFSNELAQVQEEIERMKGRIRYLEHNVEHSTVELRLYEKLEEKGAQMTGGGPSLSERMSKAVQGSLNVMVTVFEGVLVVLAGMIPVAAAAGIIGIPVYWLWKRRK